MSDGVLPALLVVSVEGVVAHDVVVNTRKSQPEKRNRMLD